MNPKNHASSDASTNNSCITTSHIKDLPELKCTLPIALQKFDGEVIQIAENSDIKDPLVTEFSGNHLFIVGKGSSLTIIAKTDDCAINLITHENSVVTLFELCKDQSKKVNLNHFVSIGKNSTMHHNLFYVADLHGSVNVVLTSQESKILTRFLAVASMDQESFLDYTVTHDAPNTSSDVRMRGVVRNNSVGRYRGKVIINRSAPHSNSFLSDHILRLHNSIAEPYPAFEIMADNVIARHSASVSGLDSDHIFYLMSRGLLESEAKKLIITGFMREVLSDFTKFNLGEVLEGEW